MKHIYTLILLISFSFGFSQDFKDDWKKVVQFELDGKIKSAHEVVNAIYLKAKRKKIQDQIIKCFFYQSKFIQVSEENYQTIVINNLTKEIKEAKNSEKALLNFIYVSILERFYQNHQYSINQRTTLQQSTPKDFKTWTSKDFQQEINAIYNGLLRDEKTLRATNIKKFASVFEISPYTDTKQLSVYDFLQNEVLNFRFKNLYAYETKKLEKISLEAFKKTSEFILFKTDTIKNLMLKKIIETYQHNEKYCLKNSNTDLAALQYNRMKRFSTYFDNPEYYITKISELEKTTNNAYLLQDIKMEKAKYYFMLTKKGSEKYFYPETLALIENVLNNTENPNAKSEAETLKEKILRKNITLNIPDQIYPNQNYRAFVEFKNIDTLKVSYYKIPLNLYKEINKNKYYSYNNRTIQVDRDSLILNYIKNHQAIKSSLKVLPHKTDHFEYSTEILMDNLDTGIYLLFFETINPFGYHNKIAYAYHTIQVSNLDYVEERNNAFDSFQVFNRKTGQPIEKAKVQNDNSTELTNKIGQINFKQLNHSPEDSYSELVFTKEKDTLFSSYNKTIKYDEEDKNFEAKIMVFFDRAIYRPGQKMYFKGFVLKNKNKIKSVVPFLTVHITINNAADDEVKTLDIQTNEFGSFNGEFDIPKNIITGEFYLTVEEPYDYEVDTKYYDAKEDEHSFWDYVNYNDYREFKFKVEEYKRPTFEITFDPIKDNFTIGDIVTISGNAKTLAGSNLNNAKVSYTISGSDWGKATQFSSEANNINDETSTDEKGNFKIVFPTALKEISTFEIENLFYAIAVSITDLNGETRTENFSVTVGNKMLKLNCIIPINLYLEETNSMDIKATTLNNYPINTKGTITFTEQIQKEFLIKRDHYPELPTMERKEFEALFPYEAYDAKDIEVNENQLHTISFDTEKESTIKLPFLKNFKPGKYKVTLEAKDKKGNLITNHSNFELLSKNKLASKKSLFSLNMVEGDKNYFVFEIQSVIPDLYVNSKMFSATKKIKESIVQLKNGVGLIKISKETNYSNDLQFHFSTLWENNFYADMINISKEEIEPKLDFEVLSMRNKIEPSSNENWSFIVKNSQLQAEVLASMYDTSLDQFATDNWTIEKFNNYARFATVSHPKYNWYNNTIRFENLYFNWKYYKTYVHEPRIDWFGFDFNSKNNYLNTQYLKKVGPNATIPKSAKTVYGVVTDDSGFPLPGASIQVKGTNRSSQTDFDGYYEIDVEKGETLQFNFVGFINVNIKFEKEKNINVTLNGESLELEGVVVVAQGFSTKKAYAATHSTTVVSSENLEYYVQTLQGQVAGLNITSGSGNVGNSASVVIRGLGSVSSNSEPLYIVDGRPISREDFLKLNPTEILNVSVLKDASATALYGSRAANGVIVLSTKTGVKELEQVKTRTNFNETAFFYPNLTTDEKGQIHFSFTTPESLTKWRLRLLAHNKKGQSGYFQSDIISQKDIMVMPNMPRFVREKDEINLSVKVVNLTMEEKLGNAILLLYDAATETPIDAIALNANNTRLFNCKPKQSVVINWKITIPEGVQGLRYKVIAKSGNMSDGEENILPVLTDKILVTESIPIWVKGNTKREFTLTNLKNNTSTTLQNHAFTFEYTSNPTWLSLQSLPYLMTYEHDCSEQTFGKYYANYLAEKIITINPKIEALFKKWQNNKFPESKLKLNEELKSIVLSETPWLMDTESEEAQNKRLALLMDLNTLKEDNEKTLKKVEERLLPSGGFSWFSGGNQNRYISQNIITGIGHLNKLFPNDSLRYKNILSKTIPYLDKVFMETYPKNVKIGRPSTANLDYLYTRSFFLKSYPMSKKCDSIAQLQLQYCKEDWLAYSLLEKGYLALTLNRFNEKDFAKKIIASLKETISNNEEIGMYWIENVSSYGWYDSNISTQALLIEAFAEIDKDKEIIDAMKVWLIKNKQTKNWPTTKSTAEAIYALLSQGTDWTSIKDNTKINIGEEKILTRKLAKKEDESETGYLKLQFNASEISPKTGTIIIENKTKAPGFGGAYWQYFESLENIKSDSTQTLSIDKKLFKKVKTTSGEQLVPVENETLKVGDLLTVRLTVSANNNLEFVHLKDLRASCLEPVDVLSKYEWRDGLDYYKSTKDIATNFFFDTLYKGTYILEYDLRVTNTGVFNNGISTLQSMYAPEFSTHSDNTKIIVTE
ncbi:TonB-dependent receptor plug domain-containing protein [Flavobacterium sp. IMCC34852]|uniref:TonB-dependent receptor plug domain-containing protein n=1 Tax=Flavobacterium rivulicola TaxID=2732161 RepID=A0A7Y3VZ72_9FLAO|nr:MG2 domain-containing protein [Flavobacterium sp. IMCC34852]NNT72450.1 TonB-dependent receptor plug domain-containing protein [Flavobacterium sp. IMCC34852]